MFTNWNINLSCLLILFELIYFWFKKCMICVIIYGIKANISQRVRQPAAGMRRSFAGGKVGWI